MRTVRSSGRPKDGGLHQAQPPLNTPRSIHPPEQTPQGAETPLPGPDPPQDACENITLPQLRCGR